MNNLHEYADRTRSLSNSVGNKGRALSQVSALSQVLGLPGLPAVTASPLSVRNPLIGSTTKAIANSEHRSVQPFGWLTPAGNGGNHNPPIATQLPVSWPIQSPAPQASAVQRVQVVGQPSMNLYLEAGSLDTVTSLRRYSAYMPYFTPSDLSEIERIVANMRRLMENMSRGPYTQKDLRAMGHPYGFNRVSGNRVGQKSAGESFKPRKVARRFNGKSIGAVPGRRGSVPTLNVINEQSGTLATSWSESVELTGSGIVIKIRNTAKTSGGKTAGGAPYPWFLASGTTRQGAPLMRAHGPFTYGVVLLLDQLNAAWTRASVRAFHRSQAEMLITGDVKVV